MRLFRTLLLLFVGIPLAELALLVQLGRWVGLGPTIALVLITGVLGAWLARAEGLRVLLGARSELAAGRMPGRAIQDGLAVLVGGAVLLTPGLLTDLFGFALLLPPTRRIIVQAIRHRIQRRLDDGTLKMITIERSP